jgi:hypothetical protein
MAIINLLRINAKRDLITPFFKGGQGAVPRWRGEGVVSHQNPSQSPFAKGRLNRVDKFHSSRSSFWP